MFKRITDEGMILTHLWPSNAPVEAPKRRKDHVERIAPRHSKRNN